MLIGAIAFFVLGSIFVALGLLARRGSLGGGAAPILFFAIGGLCDLLGVVLAVLSVQ